MRITTALTLRCCDTAFRHLLQLPPVGPPVDCRLHPKKRLHYYDAAVFERSTRTTRQSNALCQRFPSVLSQLCQDTCCRCCQLISVACRFLAFFKNMELPDGFLLQAANHRAATAKRVATPGGVAAFSLCSLLRLCPDTLTVDYCRLLFDF